MESTVAKNQRLRLDLAYDGAAFHGWAAQPGQRTVQGELEDALATILRAPATLTVAGRTDAGVHARGQVAHLDVDAEAFAALPGRSTATPGDALRTRVNAILARGADGPKGFTDVVVHAVSEVPDDFDARFSAIWRAYTYRIADGPENWNPLRRDVLWLDQPLDVDAMNRAAQPLLGEHDFLSFCKPREGASTTRTLLELSFTRSDDGVAGFARADAFCHSQVRTLMGTLIEVGRGARDEEWPYRRLVEQERNGEVIVAPPHPLTLEAVGYPEASQYADQAQAARRFRG